MPRDGKGKRILVVDDEHLVRWSLRRFLESEGYDASEAASGEEAMRLVEQEAFDLVITDIIMPKMDGFEFMRNVRRTHPRLPILVITANDAISFHRSAVEAGALKTFSKPIPFTELGGVIKTIV